MTDGEPTPDTSPAGPLTVQYPSADFPATPPFRLTVPSNWVAIPATDAEMVVRSPEEIDGYHANVVVNVRRVPPFGQPHSELVRMIEAEFERMEFDVISGESNEGGQVPAYAATVEFDGPDDIRLTARQLHVYLQSSERSAHVMSVVGTAAIAGPHEVRATVDKIVQSLRLRPSEAGGDS